MEHQAALGCLIEEVGAVGEPVVAELLGDALGIWSLRALLDEVVEEAEDLKVETLETIVLVILQLLLDRVIIAV